ncbi:MAG: hypothetical protein Kow0098_05390 [Ignavibacteriaceae bacterium]
MQKFYLVIIFYFFNQIIFPQLGTNLAPLQKDNFWVYEYDDGYRYKYTVIDTNYIIDSIKYNLIEYSYFPDSPYLLRLRNDNFYAFKRDSSYPSLNNEQLYYKKNATIGDKWVQLHPYTNMFNLYYEIIDTHTTTVFNKPIIEKLLFVTDSSGLWEVTQIWCEEFGLLYEDCSSGFGNCFSILMGCLINGDVYGDTSFIVSVDESAEIINRYELYQNYPNPFNPTTTISYSIPENSLVQIKVYDILGNRVAELVNEQQSAGEYSVNFNAENLSSGVYIYRITAMKDNRIIFSQSKQMILMK